MIPRRLLIERAEQAMGMATMRSRIRIREATDLEAQETARLLFDQVWPGEGTQVTPNLLRAIVHGGGYCSIAVDPDLGLPVGAAMAIVARDDDGGVFLHSHMAGVVPEQRDRHIGTALKLHQRLWALRAGIPVVSWTFDPLVRRNAYVNIVKLGVRVEGYHVDFYGAMKDAMNAGDPSDRVVARWEVESMRAAEAAAGARSPVDADTLEQLGAQPLLTVGRAGEPVRVADPERGMPAALVALPSDIIAIRGSDADLASRWRLAVRDVLMSAGEAGLRIEDITHDGSYLLIRED